MRRYFLLDARMGRCWKSSWEKYGWMGDLVYVSRVDPKYSSAQVPKALIGKGSGLDRAIRFLVDRSFGYYD
jgi:hypothetical protein